MTTRQDIVLVVDDDFAVRDSIKFALEIEGLTVHACSGGIELLAHPKLIEAHCIVLDYKMPLMDGFSVLDRLTALKLHIPVIVITAYASPGLRARAARAGIQHVLEKPLFNGSLLESIYAVLGRGQVPVALTSARSPEA